MSSIQSGEKRALAALVHLVPWAATTLLLNLVFPLVILFVSNDPFVKQHAKESLNFQISVFIWLFICFACCFVLVGFLMFFVLVGAIIVLPIIATIKAACGEEYRYPLTFRLIK